MLFVPASRLYDVPSGTTIEHPALEGREIRTDGGHSSSGTDRFVDPPEGFHKNPDCDLHYSVELLSRALDKPNGHALIDVRRLDSGCYEVSLNAGIFGNDGLEDYDHVIAPRRYVQRAVDLLAERSLESSGERRCFRVKSSRSRTRRAATFDLETSLTVTRKETTERPE